MLERVGNSGIIAPIPTDLVRHTRPDDTRMAQQSHSVDVPESRLLISPVSTSSSWYNKASTYLSD